MATLHTPVLPPRRPSGPFYRRWFRFLARFEDGAILRTAFFLMLAGTLSVLYLDYREMEARAALTASVPDMPALPVLPAFDPDSPQAPAGPPVTSDREALLAPLQVSLGSGGVLQLVGTIDYGAADRVEAEIAARGEYVKSVSLDSPGGSVSDALLIGETIRKGKFSTLVASGALCASSCPLVFAGGVERVAEEGAAIGVHQVYAAVEPEDLPSGVRAAGLAMSDAQRTTALITRYLSDMGVDPALWLHALETPPSQLYYFSPEELSSLKLTTKPGEPLIQTPSNEVTNDSLRVE